MPSRAICVLARQPPDALQNCAHIKGMQSHPSQTAPGLTLPYRCRPLLRASIELAFGDGFVRAGAPRLSSVAQNPGRAWPSHAAASYSPTQIRATIYGIASLPELAIAQVREALEKCLYNVFFGQHAAYRLANHGKLSSQGRRPTQQATRAIKSSHLLSTAVNS